MPKVRIATANIKSNPEMSTASVAKDMNKVLDNVGPTATVGWQEIAPSRYKRILSQIKGFLHTFFAGGAGADPISFSGLKRIQSGVKRTHIGIYKITPSRYIVWSLYRMHDGTVFWHINTHFISSAWSGRFPRSTKLRQARWLAHERVLVATVRYLIARYGRNGVITGDFNRSKYRSPALVRLGARYHFPDDPTCGPSYYDYLITFGAKRVGGLRTLSLFSDHDAVLMDVGFPKRGNK